MTETFERIKRASKGETKDESKQFTEKVLTGGKGAPTVQTLSATYSSVAERRQAEAEEARKRAIMQNITLKNEAKAKAVKEAQERKKAEAFNRIISKKQQDTKSEKLKTAVGVAVQNTPRKVFRRTVETGRVVAEKELAKPTNFFGARGDVAKKNLQEAKLSQLIGDRDITVRSPVGLPTSRVSTGVKVSEAEKAAGLLLPETKGQALALAGGSAALITLPPVVRSGIGFLGISAPQVKRLDDPTTPKEEKLARGAIFAGGLLGGTADIAPFAQGKVSRLTGAQSPKSKPTPQDPISQSLFDSQRDVVNIGGTDVGLVPKGRGFGFSQKQQVELIEKPVTITTSARGLVPKQGGTFVVDPNVGEGKLFFSPSVQGSGGAARLSRLGLLEPNLKMTPLNAKLGIGTDRPQIVVGENVKAPNIGYRGSSELETAYPGGTKFENVQRFGSSIIDGQKVELYKLPDGGAIKGVKSGSLKTTAQTTRATVTVVNPTTSVLGSMTGVVRPLYTPSSPLVSTESVSPKITSNVVIDTQPRIQTTTTRPGGRGGSPRVNPPTRTISPPTTPRLPPIKPAVPTRAPPRLSSSPKLPGIPRSFRPRTVKTPKTRGRSFLVEVRRGGEFRAIGRTRTAFGASKLLRRTLGSTLAASGRISGGQAPLLKGLRRPKKGSKLIGQGQVFVEPRQFRLSKEPEIREIQVAKKRKKKKR